MVKTIPTGQKVGCQEIFREKKVKKRGMSRLLHAFFIRIVFFCWVKYSYDMAKYKGEIFLMHSYFSE